MAIDLSCPAHARQVWNNILPYWKHQDRPVGQRFLGSIRIKNESTEKILRLVGSSLNNIKGLRRLSVHGVNDHFQFAPDNWLKIFTFALSEYAYYHSQSAEAFWRGFCKFVNFSHSDSVEVHLRDLAFEGIDRLGLVKASGGYKCISTLWLQSGVPQKNLEQFAQLLQEMEAVYGWWTLAHTPVEDIAEELLAHRREHHPSWGTIANFLQVSCGDEADPISGQLVQGIAVVAHELEQHNVSIEDLSNNERRDELLKNYSLPRNFFLRSWESLIKVLTPRPGNRSYKRLVASRRKKNPSLILDVADSFCTQIMIPEQLLWQPEWKNLSGTYCQIKSPEDGNQIWEGAFSHEGALRIPECTINVRSILAEWTVHLQDNRGVSQSEWKLRGVPEDSPCLVFDAQTGERFTNPALITGCEEIFCFTPKHLKLFIDSGVEVLRVISNPFK